MSYVSFIPFQQAVYALLSADNALLALVSGIYDHVPQDAVYPYVTIGDVRTSDWSCKTAPGTELSIALNIYSREAGRKQCALVIERLVALLHDANLTVSGQTLIMLRYISSHVTLQNDGITYQGTVHFRALLQGS